MDLKKAIENRKKFESDLIVKAFEDEEFRKNLLKDPKSVIEKELNKKFPEGIEVKVVEEAPNTITIVLPRKTAKADSTSELSEESLDKVAGGGGFTAGVIAAAVTTDGVVVYGVYDITPD